MTHKESVIACLVFVLMLAGGLTWAFGAWGLIGVGGIGLLAAIFVKEVDDEPIQPDVRTLRSSNLE